MIAGGSTYEALRFGVSSDVGHRGLAIQEGHRAVRQRHRRPEPAAARPARPAGGRLRRGKRTLRHRRLRGQRGDRHRMPARGSRRPGRSGFVLVEIDLDEAGPAKRQLRRERHLPEGPRPRRQHRPDHRRASPASPRSRPARRSCRRWSRDWQPRRALRSRATWPAFRACWCGRAIWKARPPGSISSARATNAPDSGRPDRGTLPRNWRSEPWKVSGQP